MLQRRRQDLLESVPRTSDHYDPAASTTDGCARPSRRYLDEYVAIASSHGQSGLADDIRRDSEAHDDGSSLRSPSYHWQMSDSSTGKVATDRRRQTGETPGHESLSGVSEAACNEHSVTSAPRSARRLSISSTSTESILMEADWMLNITRRDHTPQTTEVAEDYIGSLSDGLLNVSAVAD